MVAFYSFSDDYIDSYSVSYAYVRHLQLQGPHYLSLPTPTLDRCDKRCLLNKIILLIAILNIPTRGEVT